MLSNEEKKSETKGYVFKKKHKGITIYHIHIFGKKFGQTKVLLVRQELKVCLTECQANFSAVSRSLIFVYFHNSNAF
jgi:hypothetical protein